MSDGTGVGLGLSIVDAIINAHRGTMTIVAPADGGLHIRVQLPIADAPNAPAGTTALLVVGARRCEPPTGEAPGVQAL